MTQVAIGGTPCNTVVMTHSTKFAIDNINHRYIVSTGAHLKTQLRVAYLAPEADPMEPMWKYDRTNPFFFGASIQHHIRILGLRRQT